MKKQKTKSSNEIMLLVDAIKKNKGLNNLQAVSFLAGLFYSYASQENIEEIFEIVSKQKVGGQLMIFYNGFNLLVDLVLVAIAYVIGHGVGYRKNKPPF